LGKTITISNQKGGVGKTTTVNTIASVLRKKKYKVLCVDFDPQGNLSFGFGADTERAATIYNVLKQEIPTRFAIQRTGVGDIIPADILLSGAEVEFTGRGREFLLRDTLSPICDAFDYILIDSPPGLGFLTINAFAASNGLLIPLLPDIYSLQGITRIYDTIDRVRRTCNPKLKVDSIFLVQFDPRQSLCREVQATVQMIARDLNLPLAKTTVRRSVQIAKAQALQMDIVTTVPHCTSVWDYERLTEELLKGGM